LLSNLTVTQKGLILLLVPVIFEVGFFAFLSDELSKADARIEELETAKRVLLKLHQFESVVARSVMLITNPMHQDPEEVLPRLEELKEVFRKGEGWKDIEKLDPDLSEVVEESTSLSKSFVKFLDEQNELIIDRGDASNIGPNRKTRKLKTRILAPLIMQSHELTQKVVRIESRIMSAEPKELANIRGGILGVIIGGLVCGALLTIALAMLFSRDILERIKIIARNAHLVSAGKPLPPPQSGRDEIAKLDRVLHETNDVFTETRRKELAILDNAADVICSLDERLRFTGVNETVDKIWKYSQDELLGRPLISLIPKSMQGETTSSFERIAGGAQSNSGHSGGSQSGGTTSGEIENVIRCNDGTFKTFSWTVNWSPTQKTFFCVAHDITERRAVERLKQQFLSMVSHDLRAPVTATSLSINLLISGKRGELSEGVTKILERTETSIVRLTELVNDLLELDKLEAGKLQLNRTTVSAYEVCTAAKDALEAMASSAYVKVQNPSGDAAIYGDELRLVQAVTNLLSNAIKFSPKDGTVFLSIAKANGFIELRITDQGPGIEREDAALIFEKFRQSRTAKQTSVKSTGLGLAIVKAIADAHGGEVGVDSEPGKGSTFWIRVPEDREDDSP